MMNKVRSARQLVVTLGLCSLLALSGCSDRSQDTADASAAKPFAGQSIMVIVPKLHANLVRGPILEKKAAFEARTGAKIRVVTPGWDDTIKNIRTSLTDDFLHYDIFVVTSMWKGTLLGGNHIEPVPESIRTKIDWNDILPIYRKHILSWDGVAYGLPYDGDCINLYYRKDIFENETYKARFKAKMGYDLAPPKTWKAYEEIAAFFNGWDWENDGKIEYGNTGVRVRGDVTLLQFFARAAAYAKHPDDNAYYFDVETMKPRINSPAFVRALEEYIAVMKYAPEGIVNFAGHDLRNTFVAGEALMGVDWGNLGTYSANSPVSIVQGKVGYAQIPGSDEVYNSRTKVWEKHFNQVTSVSGNWMFMVNRASKEKDLAFEFATYMTSPEMTRELTVTSGTGINPSRYSHFNDPQSWNNAGFSTDEATRYLNEITLSLANENVVYDITIPGAGQYYQAFDEQMHLAVTGQISPKKALDDTAAAWEKITEELGREAQIRYHKATLAK